MLKAMNIKNMTVFSDADFKFAPGLNVIIGENGSGKSHILKAAYATIAAAGEMGRRPGVDAPTKSMLQKKYAEKLLNIFRPDSLGRLARRKQGRERCELNLNFSNSKLNVGFGFATSSKTDVQIHTLPKTWNDTEPVFLPTRELLTIYPGFVSMYDNHYLEFEETWRDTCLLLGNPALKGPRMRTTAALLEPLEDAMGGKVVLDTNGRFYLNLPGQGKMEMFLVAEGLRKLAMLAQLIGTGSLVDKGYLFWDEPEANLNPKLIKTFARVILSLCKSGIQIFIATHSLFLLRELEILSKSIQFNAIEQRFFALPIYDAGVEVEQGQAVDELNSLVLLDEELAQSDRFMDVEDDHDAD